MTLLRVAALVSMLALFLSGCQVMQRISDGAYRNAIADGATRELSARGVHLTGRPDCAMDSGESESLVRVRCTARTRAGEPVTITGTATEADTEHPREVYVIEVAGRETVRTTCLGPGCG